MSGKFSVLCKGRLIKDGRDVRAVNEITLSGDFTELLRSIVRVGGDLRFSMPGRQLRRQPLGNGMGRHDIRPGRWRPITGKNRKTGHFV